MDIISRSRGGIARGRVTCFGYPAGLSGGYAAVNGDPGDGGFWENEPSIENYPDAFTD
jgi:hypothetical protein